MQLKNNMTEGNICYYTPSSDQCNLSLANVTFVTVSTFSILRLVSG